MLVECWTGLAHSVDLVVAHNLVAVVLDYHSFVARGCMAD